MNKCDGFLPVNPFDDRLAAVFVRKAQCVPGLMPDHQVEAVESGVSMVKLWRFIVGVVGDGREHRYPGRTSSRRRAYGRCRPAG